MKKYALWVKCLTFALCVVMALCVAVSGLGVLVAAGMGMYAATDYTDWMAHRYYDIANAIANEVMVGYGVRMSETPQWLLEQTGLAYNSPAERVGNWFELDGNEWYYKIENANGTVVEESEYTDTADKIEFIFENQSASYPVIVGRRDYAYTAEPTIAEYEDVPNATEVYMQSYKGEAYEYSLWDPNTGEEVYVRDEWVGTYTVTVGISKNYSGYAAYAGIPQSVLAWVFSVRFALIAAIAVSFCLFVAAFVFLMILAGRDPETGGVKPIALNKLPLDLYLAAGIIGTALGCMAAYELLDVFFYDNSKFNVLVFVLLCGCGVGVATLDMGFFMAMAAQFKVTGRYWFTNSICGRMLKWLWKGVKLARIGIRKIFGMLPVIWQWIAVGGALGIILLIICAGSASYWYYIFPLFLWCLLFAGVVLYCGYCYGIIHKGIKRMNEGDLQQKIDTKYLIGSFKTIAEDLNALADVAAIAAEKQLKSERMKTELITNVSHDIKTPLTSVINYVDLLQQPHTEEEGEQYLEVLSRQSIRLKKLVEDLMDMSKASSGSMAVNITSVDAVETVNQALGEFSDKLEQAQLIPVFRSPDSQLHMLADGRITWRVLSNLLSNVVKYALPGTRVYIDLLRLDKTVILSVKNISREELNISAEELTERFVRGDASRNTEGSGLGLNIAQSLMQLQKGNLEITVDGDLFKVTLTFLAS